jgi:hypothetical protein
LNRSSGSPSKDTAIDVFQIKKTVQLFAEIQQFKQISFKD